MDYRSIAPCCRKRQTGATLIIVLFLITMLQLLLIAVLEKSTLDSRMAANMNNTVQAAHAADAGLLLCLQRLKSGSAPVRNWAAATEPAYWRTPNAFEGPTPAAFEPVSRWPHAARPPQCLIEFWPLLSKPNEKRVYLATARGFGATAETQAWVQAFVTFDRATAHCAWRAVAGRPEWIPETQ